MRWSRPSTRSGDAVTTGAAATPDADGGGRGRLDQAPLGATVVVESIDGRDLPLGQRLADLGFLPGTPVTPVRRAPLGDPTVYELRGYHLGLRRRDARRVRVTPA